MTPRQRLRRSGVVVDLRLAFIRRCIGQVGEEGTACAERVGTG